MKGHRKGYTLLIDALVALLFILIIVTTIYSISFSRNAKSDVMAFKELHYVSEDALDVLNKNGVLDNLSASWAINSSPMSAEMAYANMTAREYLEQMLPPGVGYNLTIEEGALSSTIAVSNSSRPSLFESPTSTHSTRVLVGYGSDKPTVSYSARATLNSMAGRVLSRYVYFGGFEGQGNLTKYLDLPDDASIKGARMQLNSGEDFTLYINGIQSGTYNIGAPGTVVATDIDLFAYKGNFHGGRNIISVNFSGSNITAQYIGGGYVKVDYTTSRWNDLPDFETYNFPGIKGIINLYSSFFIPGALSGQGMTVYLHYLHNISGGVNVYLDIGKYRVYNSTVTGEHMVTIDWDTIMNKTECCGGGICVPACAIAKLSNKTIPFKLGTENFTFAEGGDAAADAILITDVSGSMGWCLDAACSAIKIDVAKQVDKRFVTNMLNYGGTTVGLVSYSTGPDTDSLALTTDETLLNNTIGPPGGYSAGGSTCISCGINTSTNMLRASGYTDFVSRKSSWRYYLGTAPADASGRRWNASGYDDSGWSSGNAIFGFEPSATNPQVTTTISRRVNLWDRAADLPQPVSFTTGLNYTHPAAAPTFGPLAGDDGWDWQIGAYGGAGTNVNFQRIQESGNWRVRVQAFGRTGAVGQPASGAYGVQFKITPEAYACVAGGGSATLLLDYMADETGVGGSESYTIYARVHGPGATPPATYVVWGPSTSDRSWHTYTRDVTSRITASGDYYLDFGTLISSTAAGDNVQAYFDNIDMVIGCPMYFRKNFTVSNSEMLAYNVVMSVLSDDHAEIYVNGRRVENDTVDHTGAYWNRLIKVDGSYFVVGENNIAVKLYNDDTRAKFDLRLEYKKDSRTKAMLVMSDGMANRLLIGVGSTEGEIEDASVEAVNKACEARTYNISVYAVAFGEDADNETLKKIACWNCNECDPVAYYAAAAPANCWLPGETYSNCSRFYGSSDADELSEIYEAIAQQIAKSTLSLQMISIDLGSVSLNNTLYPDSTMMFDIITTPTLTVGESLLTFESTELGVSNIFFVPDMTRPIDAKVTSYSGPYWTKNLRINSTKTLGQWETVYNLSSFNNAEYKRLGDPYIVNIPVEKVGLKNNSVEINVGGTPADTLAGSPQDKVIYMVALKMLLAYSQPQKTNDGCNWTVQFYDGTMTYMPAPYTYDGPQKCSYNSSTYLAKKYDNKSAVNEAVYNLFKHLDTDPYDGKLDVKFNPNDVAIDTTTIGGVRSLWGPVRIKLILWM